MTTATTLTDWRCDAGHDGTSREVPELCPLAWCGRPVEPVGRRGQGRKALES